MTKSEASNVIDSSIAATIARLCTHPLDTIRVRIQTTISFPISSSSSTFPISSVLPKSLITIKNSSIIQLIRTTPIKSYYSGISIATILGIPALSSYLFVYDNSKYYISEKFGIRDDKMINHMLSGALAETISGVFWTPMEVLKSKLQMGVVNVINNESNINNINNGNNINNINKMNWNNLKNKSYTINLINFLFKREGIRGFFKGYLLSLAVFIPHTIIYFVVYEKCKKWGLKQKQININNNNIDNNYNSNDIDDNNNNNNNINNIDYNNDNKNNDNYNNDLAFTSYILYSGFACAIAASISNILDVVKTRWQVSFSYNITGDINNLNLNSPKEIIKNMYYNEGGLKAFTKGMGARVMWMVPASAISMTNNDNYNNDLAFTSYILYSGFACAIAASISNILDVVKTRWQVSFSYNITGDINNLNLNSPKEIIKNMYYNEGGLKAFTKGMGARVMWMVPASAISMTVFETLKNRRKKGNKE
ncbi:hypothetical protein Glove_251g37 [Diversispora epigaea]|uniref:Mitochondrial carrier protein n=1 Tax=Diversispora epigaea TaxID=1348612 RepID=A0A397I7X9_9GLOM|nr:hypothetical protein Glove_251g37 [Diversispora epigaea]